MFEKCSNYFEKLNFFVDVSVDGEELELVEV
jgi:hypothetical protein